MSRVNLPYSKQNKSSLSNFQHTQNVGSFKQWSCDQEVIFSRKKWIQTIVLNWNYEVVIDDDFIKYQNITGVIIFFRHSTQRIMDSDAGGKETSQSKLKDFEVIF